MLARVAWCHDGPMQHSLERRTQATRYWLLARSAELRHRVSQVQADLRGGRLALPADSGDDAIMSGGEEQLQRVASAALEELHEIAVAMKRLDDGTFSACQRCGAQIEPERIEAAPYAITCAACACGE